ncbi:MAG: HD domain-containing protein [Dechloromonas sp.]|nr:HD domain-containing protein [Dechloromonas sp.]
MPGTSNGSLDVDLRQVVYALSDALDLVGIDDVAHGKRVGAMAASCAREAGLSGAETTFLFDLGMLHDIGVSTTTVHRHLVSEFDWESSQGHCDIGYALLRDFAPLAALAEPVLYHHTRWERFAGLPDVAPETAERANLIYLVDRVDALAAPYYSGGGLLMHVATIRDTIAAHAGRYFSPRLVELFLAASASEAFWLQLEPRGIQAVLQEMLEQGRACRASHAELKQLAEIFSRIVDAKSPFTAEHSLGVARLARWIAERMGVSPANCEKLEIAGLLHDLGKLRIPDEILDKPAGLDAGERLMMNAHSFETFQILRHIRGFEEITRWAAYHHEEPDGSGYPFRLHGVSLPLEARILRVADIFQAMAQDRPYRKGLSGEAVLAFLERLVADGRVEAEIVRIAAADIAGAMGAARPSTAVNA